jgi:peptidoglycan L-alanyl-D-glutamate endopeptidase CwlK
MSFTLSKSSLKCLHGVHPDLVRVVQRAIILTECDFKVIEGLRTVARQKRLFEAGATRTMNSRHLTGHAVDLAALVDGKVRWDWPLYSQIAKAMKQAAIDENVPIVWGAVWDKNLNMIVDIDNEVIEYGLRMRKKGIKPLIDGPHFNMA